jgi:hypothetical protein
MSSSRGIHRTEQRLIELHKLRDQIDAEIRGIEDALVRATVAREKAAEARIGKRRDRRQRVAECGTPSGYYRHRRTLNEPACEPCKLAHRVAEQIRVRRRREESQA